MSRLSGRLGYAWRVVATGFSFFCFGAGGSFLSLVVFPLMHLLPGARHIKRNRARRVIAFCFGLFVNMMCLLGIMRLRIEGREQLTSAPGVLVIANHPTLIDIVVLLSLMPSASCVVKTGMWKNPFYWGVVRAADYIDNGSPESLISGCVASLERNEPLVIFPEGTRTRPGQSVRFSRGAAYVALTHGAPLLPVVITCSPPTLTKGEPWYRIPPSTFELQLSVGEPLPISTLTTAHEVTPIVARRLTEALQHYFSSRLKI